MYICIHTYICTLRDDISDMNFKSCKKLIYIFIVNIRQFRVTKSSLCRLYFYDIV